MTRIRVAPIVEGHGEDRSIRTLLQRTWTELLGGEYVDVIKPIRHHRSKLLQTSGLQDAVTLALLKLAQDREEHDPALVLVLLDADEDPPCILGPRLLRDARQKHTHADICCVLANKEFETWFVAAAESLREYLEWAPESAPPQHPEESRSGKAWIDAHFRGSRYSETIDQPRLTAKMDLALCRSRSPSFDKLCRELERRLGPVPQE